MPPRTRSSASKARWLTEGLAVTMLGVIAACPEDDEPIAECTTFTAQAQCEQGAGCLWTPDAECLPDCEAIHDRDVCREQQDACFWDGRDCFFGGI